MQVWQHLDNMDHLRRRAEGMIDAANGPLAVSAASNGHMRTTTQDAQKFGIVEGMQSSTVLVDFSSEN